jgi:hypothetical protein
VKAFSASNAEKHEPRHEVLSVKHRPDSAGEVDRTQSQYLCRGYNAFPDPVSKTNAVRRMYVAALVRIS